MKLKKRVKVQWFINKHFITNQSNSDKDDQKFRSYMKFSGMAIQMMVPIGAGAWGGHYIDQSYQNSKPIWTIILSLLGITIALYMVIRSASKMSKDD